MSALTYTYVLLLIICRIGRIVVLYKCDQHFCSITLAVRYFKETKVLHTFFLSQQQVYLFPTQQCKIQYLVPVGEVFVYINL